MYNGEVEAKIKNDNRSGLHNYKKQFPRKLGSSIMSYVFVKYD